MELDPDQPFDLPPSKVRCALPVPPGIEVLAKRLASHARADHAAIAAWCRATGRTMLQATPETVAAFIDAQAELKSRATVKRYRSSVAALHRAAGLPNPCND